MVIAAALAGCGPAGTAPPVPAVREDTAPIQKRVTNIGDRFTVRWVGGTLGDERVPGPNASWIDAVVTVGDAAAVSALRAALGPSGVEARPAVAAALGDPGAGMTSAGLDAFVAVEPGTVRAFLQPERGVLVVKYFRG